jgi:diphthamide biosynthesis enzyme Dph1/Dph2-like protein
MNIRTAETVRTILKKKGKHAWIVVMNELEPRKLMGMKFDCLVNCACPRLTNDSAMFRKPIINPDDVDRL